MSTICERIAFVTPSLPWPSKNGGEVVSSGVLDQLAEIGPVDLFALKPRDREVQTRDAVEIPSGICASARVFPWHRGRSLTSLLRSYAARMPLSVYRNACPALRRSLREYCRHNPRAVIIADHWLSAATVFRSKQASQPCVLHAHNAEYVMWQRYAAGNPVLQTVVAHEGRRVREYERRLTFAFDQVVTLSELDADRLHSLARGLPSGRLCCIRPAVDPLPGPVSWSMTDARVLFVGTLSWPPNIQGLARFLSDVWPQFHRRFPEAKLTIVGGGLPGHTRRYYRAIPGVELRGFVEDLDPLFATSRLFVAPVVGGSGVKIKLLHALARGLPALTTPEGAEGIDIRADVLMRYSNWGEFVGQVENIWDNPARWRRLSLASRDAVLQKYSRSHAQRSWTRLISELVRGSPGRPATRDRLQERSAA